MTVLLDFSFLLFIIALTGIILNKKSYVLLLAYVELALFSISLNFILFSRESGDPGGQIAALFILAVAAADAAIGLGLLINAFQCAQNITVSSLNSSRG